MQIFATILTGVIVFVGGQTILKMVIEPIQKLRETIAEIAFILTNNHVVYHNSDFLDKQQVDDAYENVREMGGRLVANQTLVPFYGKLHKLFSLPSKEEVKKASERLYGISLQMDSQSDARYYYLDLYRIEICENLHISDPITNGLSKEELIESIKKIRGPNAL